MKSDSGQQQILVQICIDLAGALAHHHHSFYVIKKSRVLSVMIAHCCREVHYAVLVSLIETEAEALKVFITERLDPADDVVIHVFRFLRSSLVQICSLICALPGFSLYRVKAQLVLSSVVAAFSDHAYYHAGLYPGISLHLVRCEVPFYGLYVSCRVCETHIKMSLSVVSVAYVNGLHEIPVLYAMPFIRPEIFDVIWFHAVISLRSIICYSITQGHAML